MKTTMMKNYIAVLLFMASVLPVCGQSVTCRDVFREMPDSIVPYLTENNRLDMLDFMDSHMKAVVQNRFDGHSEMLSLTDDSVTLKLSEALRMTICLVDCQEEVDGAKRLICVKEQIGIPSSAVCNKCTFYSIKWRELDDKMQKLVK